MVEFVTVDEGAASGSVQSVARAFRILEVLAGDEPEMPLAAVADAVGLPMPTTHRLLKTMQQLGHVRQTDERRYALGPGLIVLGQRATPPMALRARGLLSDLEDMSQETANFAVLDGDLIAYVAQVPSRHRMRMFTEVGRRVLPHSTGVGKAILSMLPEAKARELVRRTGLPRFTASTLTDEDDFMRDLRESRRRGFAADDSEQEVGVRCIAVAVPGASPGAAVSISGPAARIVDARVPEIVAALTEAAAKLAL